MSHGITDYTPLGEKIDMFFDETPPGSLREILLSLDFDPERLALTHYLNPNVQQSDVQQSIRRVTLLQVFISNRRREQHLLHIIKNPDTLDAFKATLSASQLLSLQVLQEWLTFRAANPLFEHIAVVAVNEAVDKLTRDGHILSSALLHSYHLELARLWYVELCRWPSSQAYSDRRTIQEYRGGAILSASCHRLSLSCFMSDELPLPGPSFIKTNSKMPRSYEEACPWLKREAREAGMPYFLWDVHKKRTVEVREITALRGSAPEYLAVSHTWGRWRLPNAPWIRFDGVPWKVPQNSRFKVENLPEILQNLPYDYVWIDLFTIPQEESSTELIGLQKAEIGRQATIFQHASTTVAWLNDITSWSGTQAVVQWLCVAFLRISGELSVNGFTEWDANWTASFPNSFTELYHEPEPFNLQVNPWFTSLWTLQEVCLRPDMLLCNRNRDPLMVSKTVPVCMSDIAALLLKHHKYNLETVPKSVAQLHRLFEETGMFTLSHATPLTILYMGERRYCKHRRAEAIMSAVGATEWFRRSSDARKSTEKLVLKRYPLEFLNDVRHNVGSVPFFSTGPAMQEDVISAVQNLCNDSLQYYEEFPALGTMLPFGISSDILFDHTRNIEHSQPIKQIISSMKFPRATPPIPLLILI